MAEKFWETAREYEALYTRAVKLKDGAFLIGWRSTTSFASPKIYHAKRNRKVFIPHDADIYKHRNRIERCFCRLKHFRRFATRYDRRTIRFAGFVHLAAAMIWLP